MANRGFSLVETVTVLAILLLVATASIPPILALAAGVRIRSAAQEVRVTLVAARHRAIRSGHRTAVRFERDGTRYRLGVYEDGNGNGVRNEEIARGIDRPVGGADSWSRGDVTIGILRGEPIPDPSSPSHPLDPDDPVRFNRSDLCSFSAVGESTPGSVYLTDHRRWVAAVRVYNRSAKIRSLYYRAGEGGWKP